MMSAMSLSALSQRFGWKLIGDDLTVTNITTDSRAVNTEDLFVALRGENFDGHAFVTAAVEDGAGAVLVDHECEAATSQLVCEDTMIGLAQLAQFNREQFKAVLIALTGSAGKTTTKTMIAHILSKFGSALATKGNLNNEIGVPLTALRLASEHEFAVIEMGAAKGGDIAYLCSYVQPDIALVTNAGRAHVEGFGSVAQTARAKGEIFEALSPSGTAVINVDSEYVDSWRQQAAGRKILGFGFSDLADVRADEFETTLTGSKFSLSYKGDTAEVRLPAPGLHNVMNALAATACCLAAGLRLQDVATALCDFEAPDSRLIMSSVASGATLINDSYNANPEAFKAAIDVLVKADNKPILVMGDMGELGVHTEASHIEVGAYAKAKGVYALYGVGPMSLLAVQEFGENGFGFTSKAELIRQLTNQLGASHTVLVKGSRSAGMEEVVAAIKNDSTSSDKKGALC